MNSKNTNLKIILPLLLLTAALAAAVIAAVSLRDADPDGRTFFHQFVIAGGPIVWFILIPLSLLTCCLAIEYAITIRRKTLLPADIAATIKTQLVKTDLPALRKSLARRRDLASTALAAALTEAGADWFRIRSSVTESFHNQAAALLRKIEWLNLIGNVSPMIGLFGTVFGMIKLFNTIVLAAGQPQPAQLAEGISVALVTTFWGLFIAIPALALYGIFRNRLESLVSDAVTEAEALLPAIRVKLKQYQTAKLAPQPPIRETSTRPRTQPANTSKGLK